MTPEEFQVTSGVSRETLARLERYAARLLKWNSAINLVSRTTSSDLWSRHVLDSLQLLEHAPNDARRWVDLGSGGGFPGLVVAIAARESRPDLRLILVESDQRKAAFLREAARDAVRETTVIAERAETASPQAGDVVSARALAPLTTLLGFVERHLTRQGCALLLKGAGHRAEIEAARRVWSFSSDVFPSKTDPEAAVLKIWGISRV